MCIYLEHSEQTILSPVLAVDVFNPRAIALQSNFPIRNQEHCLFLLLISTHDPISVCIFRQLQASSPNILGVFNNFKIW